MPERYIPSRSARRTRSPAPALPKLGSSIGLCAALFGCSGADVVQNGSEVLQVRADRVVDGDGNSVWLRGVELSNWTGQGADADPPSTYADQADYGRIAAMGMNTVAFYFSSDQFEDQGAPGQYLESGFDWLDQHIAWAKASGIRLIPSLVNPPGSSQWTPVCDGNRLWDVQGYQDRTVALWQALAKRYADEPAIAGYDLLVGPVPSTTAEQWQGLASRLVSAVRNVDRQHIVVIEATAGSACTYKEGVLDATDLFRVDDPNVLYEFSADVPWTYVAQNLPDQNLGDGGAYPDETALGPLDSDLEQFEDTSMAGIPPDAVLILKPQETSWTQKTFAYKVTNPDFQLGIPTFQSDHNPGKVFFDDYVVTEYDENLNVVRTVLKVDPEDLSGLYLWQGYSDGTACVQDCPAQATVEMGDAHSGLASVSLSGSTTLANLANGSLAFPITLNHTYEMSGWIKGENSDPNGSSRFRLDFYKYNANGGVLPLRNKDNLALYLQSFVAWGQAQHVPLYVGGFGTGQPTFLADKGGVRWVTDMTDLLKANGLHFAYDEYHGDDFGIYSGNHGLPDPAMVNQPLVELLTSELAP
jgi:endoglucanase